MAKTTVTLVAYTCDRCTHWWIPRRPHPPKCCPNCKSRDWNAKGDNHDLPKV